MNNTIILFYKYIHISTPNAILKWQKKICQQLALKGRIIIAHEGINGTLGGADEQIEEYKSLMRAHELFADIDFKESKNTQDHFPRLRIVVKNEIVNLGLDHVSANPNNAGTYLEPAQAHELIEQKPDNLIIIDCRNQAESAIGIIEGAIRPEVTYFREFPAYIDNHVQDFKDKQILMYCTGGVRCERASAYIKSKAVAKEVFHIKGGIHKYIEQFPHGFFRGKNYVFDGRMAVAVTKDVLGHCYICKKPCDDYTNCLRAQCNRHFISCSDCLTMYKNTCSQSCHDLIATQNAAKRPQPVKNYDTIFK